MVFASHLTQNRSVSKNICTRRKKATVTMRRSPRQTNVFKSLLNCTSEMSLSRNVTGREFQRHGPATEKLLSPRRVRVLLVAHVKTWADRSDRRPMSVKSWQSSARYCGSIDQRKPCGIAGLGLSYHQSTVSMINDKIRWSPLTSSASSSNVTLIHLSLCRKVMHYGKHTTQ